MERRSVNLADLNAGPGPDAVPMETSDILIWDSRNAWASFREWPTYGFRSLQLTDHPDPHYRESNALSTILQHDWEVVSVSVVRCGFLWLSEAKVWVFKRRVVWLRDGSETSFVGHRMTPAMPKQAHESDEDDE